MLKRKIDTLATYGKLGPKRAMLYGRHMLRLRSGRYLKTLPVGTWDTSVSGKSFFRVPCKSAFGGTLDLPALINDAERISAGELRYFFTTWLVRPDSWVKHPISGADTAKDHWSLVGEFDEEIGDIKWIWDASRFEWAYVLGRAFAASGSEKYAQTFWEMFESWRQENPPNFGTNWRCAQECSLRMIALAWSASAFAAACSSTDERLGGLWETVYKLAQRIEETLGYGIAQNNNHAISEATALLVASVCLDVPEASHWGQIGLDGVNRYIVEQFEPDGSYILHSFNYQRTTMKVCLVAALAALAKGASLSKEAMARLSAGTHLLYNLQDERSGALPNYGANDGSNVMALSSCVFKDFRATIQSLAYLTEGKKLYPAGPHDEELLWLFGPEALSGEPLNWKRSNVVAKHGGYYSLRSDRAMALMRCHTYKARPLHADMLQVDFWLDGRNIAHDPGTYSYFDADGNGVYLTETVAHNTVTADGKSQMDHGRRFLWLNWTRSKLIRSEPNAAVGEHYGYRQIGLRVVHRREIRLEGTELLVIDDLISEAGSIHTFDLRWHLDGLDWKLEGNRIESVKSPGEPVALTVFCLQPATFDLKSGDRYLPDTGFSRYYGVLDSATVLSARVEADRSVRFITRIGIEAPVGENEAVVWKNELVSLSPAYP